MKSTTNHVIADNSKIISRSLSEIKSVQKNAKPVEVAIVFFDFPKSTKMKLTQGHHTTIAQVLTHNQICKNLISKYKGYFTKELGDGVLGGFNNPINACECALNTLHTLRQIGMSTKIAISQGMAEKVKLNGRIDVLGTPVDRCARIEKKVKPNQILTDPSIYQSSRSFLRDYDDVRFGQPISTNIKDFGISKLYPIKTTC